uniref:WSC domain-containing protein n=1 Tax=Branchiostoma floridae TaxID=7739 RepID=C3ZFI2_BRAFL|eukprot:XP_002592725.1 hypothetical protein BRAFLDRAFT_67165 [Branchiostoma floridae]
MAVAVVGTASQMVLASTSSEPPVGNVDGIYEGCFPEFTNSNDLLLPHARSVIKDLTNVKCRDHCHHEGFDYSGTGFPAVCFCGTAEDVENVTKLHENMCDFPCPGDSDDFCGGEQDQISVYYIHELLGVKLPVDVTTLYIAIVAGIHIIAAILHPGEIACVINGAVYLLTLPFCRRCYREPEENEDKEAEREPMKDEVDNGKSQADDVGPSGSGEKTEKGHDGPETSVLRFKPTRQWLQSIFGAMSNKVEKYEPMFTREGYTDTSFIAGMTDKDLKDIGVTDPHDRDDFRRHIKKLHQDEPDIDITVPDDVEIWLEVIGLATEKYRKNSNRHFQKIPTPRHKTSLKI